MTITTSPNVSNFDYDVLLDISTATAKAVLTDISTYISGGQADIIGINFKIIDPNNIAFHETVYPPDIDLTPGLTDYETNLPTFNGAVKFGVYKIFATLIDEDGTQYEWEENGLNYKSVRICKPNTLVGATGNFGGMQLLSDFDCDTNTLLVEDGTAYVYNGVAATETDTDVTVTYPVDPTGTPSYQTATFMPFTLPIYLSGVYSITAQVIQTYQYTETTSVKVGYKYQKSTDVQCGFTLCKALCEYERLAADIKNCVFKSVAETQEKQKQYLLISGLLVKILSFGKNCGKSFNTATILEEIREIGGFSCDCECSPAAIVPTPVYSQNTIVKGNMCGDIDMVLTQVGNSVQINLSDVHYDIDVAEEIRDYVTFTPVTDGCNKTWLVDIDFCGAIAALGCGGGGGGGTVTSFSAGNLSPLFTTNVATANTTPALTFSLTSQTSSTVFAAPNGSNGAPTFRLLNFYELGDTFTYPGNAFLFPMVNDTETALIPVEILGSNVIAVKAASTTTLPAFTYNNGAAGVGATMTANAVGAFPTIDGIAISVGERFLYKNETGANEIYNGVYVLTSNAGTWVATRATDADTTAELDPEVVIATQGTQKNKPFTQQTDSPVIGTDPIVYFQQQGAKKNAWLYNGNTVGSEQWIGTKDNFDFPIRVNNTERMVVAASTGNVGVGVAVPTARLHVVGSGTTSATLNFYTASSDGFSFAHNDDGEIYRSGALWSKQTSGGQELTTWGESAGLSSSTANAATMIGFQAGVSLVSGNGFTAVGAGALYLATVSSNTGIGASAGRNHTTGHSCTYVGFSAGYPAGAGDNSTGNYNTVIGTYALVGGNYDNVLSICGVGTGSNQIVLGGATNINNAAVCYYTDMYLGKGVTHATPTAITIHATSGSGTDIAGANLQYAIGQGTGTGIAGDHIFYKATAGSTGSTLNALSETFKIKGTDGQIFRDGTLYSVETGSFARENTSWGYNSLASATGAENTAVGFGALASVVGGTRLTAVGNRAAISNVSGVQGSYFGFKAGGLHTSDGASFFGEFSAYYATTASYMTAIGHRTMVDGSVTVGITGGSYTTAIGASAAQRGSNASISNSTYIGSRTISEASNEAVIGGYGNTNFYFGGGRFGTAGSSSLYAITMQPTSPASGSSFYANQTDANGVNWTFGVSQATGSGTSGDMIWQYAPSGSTGTTLTTLTTGMTFKGTTGELQVVNGVSIGTAGSVLGLLKLNGNTSGTVTINTAAAAGTWTLTLPTTDGNAGEYLQTDGAGVTTWAVPAGTGANTALSNLASVAINTTLLPASNDGAALGSTTFSFSDLFLASGGVLNFDNSNWVATHTSGILTVGTGDLRVTTAGTNSASVVTVGGTQTLTGKSIVATQLTGTAYTFAANNTNATAAYTLQHFEDHDLATYGGTISWNSTPPATIVSQQYGWVRIGNTVWLEISVLYTSAGTTNTSVIFTLPSDCPNPVVFANSGDAASEYMFPINGARVEATQTANPSAVRGGLRRNSGDTAFEIALIFGSTSALQAQVTISYRTA